MPDARSPIIDRSAARAEVAAKLDRQARDEGFTDHAAKMDADYAAWSNGIVTPES